jgi:hypothetical protein
MYKTFIYKCPLKFIITYSNNSESIVDILHLLYSRKQYDVHDYLHSHIEKFKLETLRQRCSLGLGYHSDDDEDEVYYIPDRCDNK